MRIPRDTSASELIKALRCLGYAVTRQTGSHIRVTTEQNGQHHETIPNHAPLKVGTSAFARFSKPPENKSNFKLQGKIAW